MKKIKSILAILLVCTLVITAFPTAAFAKQATSTSWQTVEGDSFTVETTKKNATVTVSVRKTRNMLGMYPMDSISVSFTPDGGAKKLKAKTGSYILIPSNGEKSYTLKFSKPGTYDVDVDLTSGMDSFNSGGCIEWRVVKCKNATIS